MRSRYSAFALNIPKYIIDTTHNENDDFKTDKLLWTNEISEFCKNCLFQKLEILESIDLNVESFVTFKATIECTNNDNSFIEKSKFLKINNKWLYHSGEFLDI